jgi:hypothetical protein
VDSVYIVLEVGWNSHLDYEKRLPAAGVDDGLMDMRKIHHLSLKTVDETAEVVLQYGGQDPGSYGEYIRRSNRQRRLWS